MLKIYLIEIGRSHKYVLIQNIEPYPTQLIPKDG